MTTFDNTKVSHSKLYADEWNLLMNFIALGQRPLERTVVVFTYNSYFYARSALNGLIIFGGPDNVDGVDGTDAAAVIQACLDISVASRRNVFVANGNYPIVRELVMTVQSSIEGEDYDNTIFQWTGPTNGKMISASSIFPFRISNIYLDCQHSAGYGVYISGAGGRPICSNLNIITPTIEGFHMADQDRPIIHHVLVTTDNISVKSIVITTCSYPWIIFCNGHLGNDTHPSLQITYCSIPIVFGGGYSGVISLYRCRGGIIDGVDLEADDSESATFALFIGGENTYAPVSVRGLVIANYNTSSCGCLRVYGGMQVNLDGAWFLGDNVTTDISTADSSKVSTRGCFFKSKIFGNGVTFDHNANYVTENYGQKVCSGSSEQTQAHGLVDTPSNVSIVPLTDVTVTHIHADSNNIYFTLSGSATVNWSAKLQ